MIVIEDMIPPLAYDGLWYLFRVTRLLLLPSLLFFLLLELILGSFLEQILDPILCLDPRSSV